MAIRKWIKRIWEYITYNPADEAIRDFRIARANMRLILHGLVASGFIKDKDLIADIQKDT